MPPTVFISPDGIQASQPHWYNKQPPRPACRRRYGSSVINNVFNAWSNWANATQGNTAGLLATMRVQVNNLKMMIDSSLLDSQQKLLIQQLIAEAKQALDALNPASLSQQVSRLSSLQLSSSPVPMHRIASEQFAISSNAKAALGCMAYLRDDSLFPNCAGTYQYVRERLEQIFRLMDNEFQIADIQAVRQQQSAIAPQQTAPMVVNPDGSMTPYMTQTPSAAQVQRYAPVTMAGSSTSGIGQALSPSPVAGLKVNPPSWDGTPNTAPDGQETVDSGQDWFTLYGTTPKKFASRCSRWLQASGGGQAALAAHLSANGVPNNIIAQIMPYL